MRIPSFFIKCYQFIKKNIWCLVGAIIGLFLGFWGILLGFLVGYFVSIILYRHDEDILLRSSIENPRNNSLTDKILAEPFENATKIAALSMYCYKNILLASSQMKLCFGDVYDCDWETLCRSAGNGDTVNGDLITECLAASFLKSEKNGTRSSVIDKVFDLLSAAELGWKEEDRGTRPSIYLSQLLNYTIITNEVRASCLVLGVSPNDNLRTIKAAYRQAVQVYHPDTVSSLSIEQQKVASEMFIRIQKAYDVLSSPLRSSPNV